MTNFIQFVFRIILFFDNKLRNQDKRDILNDKDIKRVLLVNTTAMGDTLLSTPAIRTVRKKSRNLYRILLRRLELAVRYTIQRMHKGTAIPFIKGKLFAYKNIGTILKKRRDIQSQKKVPDSYIDSIMDKEFF